MITNITFVSPPRAEDGQLMMFEDCCWGNVTKPTLPSLLLSCASQLEDITFDYVDLAIDENTTLSPNIAIYPIAWPINGLKTYEQMQEVCESDYQIIIALPSGYAEDIAKLDNVFAVIYSEPETVIGMMDNYDTIEEWRDSVGGICYKSEGAIIKKPHLPINIHKIKPMDYDILPNYYWREFGFASYQVTRGCVYRCKFCVWGGSTVTDKFQKTKSPETVFRDIQEIKNRKRSGFILFLISSQLTNSKKWITEFHRLVTESGEEPLPFQSNINLFDLSTKKLKMLEESGMMYAAIGLEAVTDKLLARLGKKHKFEDIKKGLKILDKSNFKHMLHLRTGFGETEADVDETIRNFKRLKKMGLTNVNIRTFGPIEYYKGTEIYNNDYKLIKHPSRDVYIQDISKSVEDKWHELFLLLDEYGWINRNDDLT